MNFSLNKKISLTNDVKTLMLLILVAFVLNMTVPQLVKAEQVVLVNPEVQELVLRSDKELDLLTERFIDYKNGWLKQPEVDIVRTYTVVSTAYSSSVDQTDSTPCITANGFNVCKNGKENVVAANFLRFGTKIRVPELYGNKVFTVQDRMNTKYNHRVDFWKTSRPRAISFGKRLIKIEVIK